MQKVLMKNQKIIILVKTRIFLLLISLCFISCSKQKTFDTEEELWVYLNDADNGYKQSKKVNNIDFSLLYKPTDALVVQELGEKAPDSLVKLLRKKYKKYLYFTLSMSRNKKELLSTIPKNKNEFGAMVNQLAFNMDKKVHLYTQSKDTLALQDYVYPRMYGMSNTTTMLFVYPRDNTQLKEPYLNLTIEDLGTQTGEVKFKIPTTIIQQQPKLSFDN